jgi:oxygen-independent coproporphyrinogen-3 oxidase
MATREPVAVYVHVPWCRHVCPYCDFNVYVARKHRPAEQVDVATLRREVAAWAARPEWRGRPAKSIYLGGGTPSLLSPEAVAAVVDGVRGALGILPDAEITLEANPGTLDVARVRGYRHAGVTRLSLGVQSLDARVLRTLGRDHRADDVHAAVAAARAAGLENVSADLMYAVPGQTLADVVADLDGLVALGLPHLSVYALTWEAGTPFARWRARGRLAPVDEDVEVAMGDAIAARLEAVGLARYEIASFARPGFASRHNTAYWDGSDYLGLGPGAHGFCATPAPGRRWSNVRDPAAHRVAVAAAGTAVADDEPLTPARARADFVWTGLRRVRDGVDAERFAARFGVALADAFPQLDGLVRDGLLERRGARVRLTPRGIRFADGVAAAFV